MSEDGAAVASHMTGATDPKAAARASAARDGLKIA